MEHGDGMDHGGMSHDHGSHDMPMPMPGGSCSVSQPAYHLTKPRYILVLTADEHALEQRYQRCMRSIRIMAYQRSILNGSIMVSIPPCPTQGAKEQSGDNSYINNIRLYPIFSTASGQEYSSFILDYLQPAYRKERISLSVRG